MTVKEAIRKRKSIRKFNEGPLTDEQLRTLMEAAQWAPSASNMQPYEFIIVKDDKLKAELVRKGRIQQFLTNAAVIFVGIGDPRREKWYKIDIAIAMEHLALQAAELGLGSCWIGAFDEQNVKEVLKVSADKQVIALMPIGIPGEEPPARPRKSFNNLFYTNIYKSH
ncbi:MAG: nitroreductase family protein [Candidatus Helarchaeota archaeon]|nr:nitroreductase family protein [Candidatus Helarchaeota archaeon]